MQDHLRRLPPLLRAVTTLLLTVLGAGLLAALLTPDDVADGEFMLGIAIVHLAFGFLYGDRRAAQRQGAGALLAALIKGPPANASSQQLAYRDAGRDQDGECGHD